MAHRKRTELGCKNAFDLLVIMRGRTWPLLAYTNFIHTYMANFNPANIEKALRGMRFPGDKEAVLNKARENGAGQDELSALEMLPEKEYTNPTEITEALSGEENADDEEM